MAAAKNERVMEMVRRELEKNPSATSQDLFEKAKKLDEEMGRLSIRQFHASYPLQVKRLASHAAGGGKRRRKAVKKAASRAGAPKRPRGRPRKEVATVPSSPASGRRRGRPRKQASAATERSGHEGVRAILMEFAGELAGAEKRADVVVVIGNVDAYVSRLVKAAKG